MGEDVIHADLKDGTGIATEHTGIDDDRQSIAHDLAHHLNADNHNTTQGLIILLKVVTY